MEAGDSSSLPPRGIWLALVPQRAKGSIVAFDSRTLVMISGFEAQFLTCIGRGEQTI
jgi:hypothetical protein